MKTLSSTLDPTRWAAGQFTRPTVHSFKLCIGSAMYICTLRCVAGPRFYPLQPFGLTVNFGETLLNLAAPLESVDFWIYSLQS